MKEDDLRKLKPGMKVKIRSDIVMGRAYGNFLLVSDMCRFIGQWVTVREILNNAFWITDDLIDHPRYYYTMEMVSKIEKFTYGK